LKFVHIASDYRCVDGNTFIFRNAVDVQNRVTISKLLNDPDFEVHNEAVLFQEPKEPKKPDEGPDACPKCGRVVKRGKYMHQKHCKGKP